VIIDTSVLIPLLLRGDPDHNRVVAAISPYRGDLVISPLVLAELDFLIASRNGVAAEVAAMRELTGGGWVIAPFGAEDLAEAMTVVERYATLGIGATDASLVVLASRYRTHTVATLDRRHFSAVQALDGKPFELVPN